MKMCFPACAARSMIARCALVAVVTVTASMSSRASRLSRSLDKNRINRVGRSPPASRIVVPDCDKFGVRVLVYLRGVLGCMYVPESQDRNRDRIGHGSPSSRAERFPHCQSVAAPPYLSGMWSRPTRNPFARHRPGP